MDVTVGMSDSTDTADSTGLRLMSHGAHALG